MPNLEFIGKQIKQLIKDKGITPSRLANQMGVSASTVSHWFHGKHITVATLSRLSQELDVSVNWLVYGFGSMPRVASLPIDSKEEALITITRYIQHDITAVLTTLVQRLNSYNTEPIKITNHAGAESFFEVGDIFRVVIHSDGTIADASHSFLEKFIDDSCACSNFFNLTNNSYKPRIQSDLEKVMAQGVGDYIRYELIDLNQQTNLFISKASLCQHQQKLCIELLLRAISHEPCT